jgi:hypothetical protein
MVRGFDLTEGELEILVDGLSDEVAFRYVLLHLGLADALEAPPSTERSDAVDAAIQSLTRLVDQNLVLVGHTRYKDGGPPGRQSPYEHVPEAPDEVWNRIRRESLSATSDLHWTCWCVNTLAGDDLARQCLSQTEPG